MIYLMGMVVPSVDIFAYTNWQIFLKNWIEQRRLHDPSVSLQSVSTRIGLRSKSHLHRLLNDPKKTLAVHLIEPLAQVMELKVREAEYWQAIVLFGRAATQQERNRAYQRIHGLQGRKNSQQLDNDGFEYFGTWYLPVLRELVVMMDWKGDYGRLARMVEPPISESQARHGIEMLIRMGLVREDSRGKFSQVSVMVQTPADVASVAIGNFQKDMLNLGARSLEKIRGNEREVTTVTFTIPREKFKRIREMMRKFQSEIAQESVAIGGRHDRVFQLNLQCFPVSTQPGKEKK